MSKLKEINSQQEFEARIKGNWTADGSKQNLDFTDCQFNFE